jgi:muramoyltetrapeptide carboxypeptidase
MTTRKPLKSHPGPKARPIRGEPEPRALRAVPVLKPGDRAALVSPSSHQGRSPTSYLPDSVLVLSGWGLNVEPLPSPEPRHLYFAGNDAERAEAFQRQYLDPDIKALFISRGGYGAARILPLLDAKRIAAAPPKAVVGFSDATALFCYLHTVTGAQTLHGPALAAPGALTSEKRQENLAALNRLLFDPAFRPEFALHHFTGPVPAAPVRGRVIGGCLSVLVTMIGTPWAPDPRGAILFLEDVGEQPYRIDRMLTHLRLAGMFEGLRAIVFGYLDRCDEDPPGLLAKTLHDCLGGMSFPVFMGMQAGHGEPNLTFPLGALAELQVLVGEYGAAQLRFL